MKTRIYITGQGQDVRLVKAYNRLHALDHITKGTVHVSAIKKADMEVHMALGTKIEDATGGKQETIE